MQSGTGVSPGVCSLFFGELLVIVPAVTIAFHHAAHFLPAFFRMGLESFHLLRVQYTSKAFRGFCMQGLHPGLCLFTQALHFGL